jgi:hypothetical protein
MRLHQLFSIDELKALDEKELEIIRDAIRDEIVSSPEILRIVKARVQGVYTQLKGTPKK